jgi:hypothetical protein
MPRSSPPSSARAGRAAARSGPATVGRATPPHSGSARLALDPAALWILDEPLAALDAEGESMLGALLESHAGAAASRSLPRTIRFRSRAWPCATSRCAHERLRLGVRPRPNPCAAPSRRTMLTLAFFVLVASSFPLGVGADPQLLARIGPA